jgi:hypothetical protein
MNSYSRMLIVLNSNIYAYSGSSRNTRNVLSLVFTLKASITLRNLLSYTNIILASVTAQVLQFS